MSQEKPILKYHGENGERYDQVIFRSDEQLTRVIDTLKRKEEQIIENIELSESTIVRYNEGIIKNTHGEKLQEIYRKGLIREGKELEHFVLELSLARNQITHLSAGQNTVIDSTPLWQIRTKPEVIETNS